MIESHAGRAAVKKKQKKNNPPQECMYLIISYQQTLIYVPMQAFGDSFCRSLARESFYFADMIHFYRVLIVYLSLIGPQLQRATGIIPDEWKVYVNKLLADIESSR